MEENNKSGMTAEGRKLRPRKPRNAEYSSSSSSERRSYGSSSYGERKSYGSRNNGDNNGGERRSYGERKSYGSRSYGDNNGGERKSYSRSYGDNNGGERKSYGSSNYGERKSYSRSYGDNNNGGERKSYSRSYGDNNGGERKSYSSSNYGERKSYSRSYGDNNGGERKSYGSSNYGERKSYSRSYGDNNNGGERKSYSRSYGDNNNGGERRSYSSNRGGGFGHKPAGRGGFNNSRPGAGRGGFNKYGNNNRRNPYQFGEASEAGINEMIGKNPIIDNSAAYSDNDTVATPIQEEIRLNKFIANSGVCSRREADQFIQAGVVTVNGEVVTELGTKVNVLKDDVRFNGERLKGEEKVYIVMNKPKGFVTSASDPHADKTVMDLLKGCTMRVFPVGRLDKNTTGVLMFTNDGEIAEKLTHPSYDKKKIYQVILDNALSQEDYDKIKAGITLTDGDIKADELEYIDSEDHRKLGIEIHSGKNRIVRRIFESLGYDVKALDRVYFAGLTKKGLQKGEWRYLTAGEVNILKMGAYI